MEKTPHNDFFTDNQTAVALGMTLRSLQNKIHRAKISKTQTLPAYFMASARGRLWEKQTLKSYLDLLYANAAFVADRMEKGSKAPPLGSMGATDVDLKIPDNVPRQGRNPIPLVVAKRKPGRPRKHPV